ncbi:CLUMA_CG016934, isoform A [Clunio marinus]|uniref:CLUMA_CG016934, isoform A n=1 Tax=Clunio marinus TaxID=568069 RepID=A0A1J1ISA6_9DIPT|nr:CLUMA_CG016934, isoform A [Clunio marinus]
MCFLKAAAAAPASGVYNYIVNDEWVFKDEETERVKRWKASKKERFQSEALSMSFLRMFSSA